uniref:Uncharacterized protein n=1 Tax=Meloidogyne incognita TaxID=6306 RepID=A0A914MLL8_MELIC
MHIPIPDPGSGSGSSKPGIGIHLSVSGSEKSGSGFEKPGILPPDPDRDPDPGQLYFFLLLLFFINCFSLRHVVSRVQIISVIAKFVASDVQFNNFYHPFENTNLRPGNIALALFGGLYSYDGWDILNYGIEDVKSPRRTMPFAIIMSMIVCASIYVLMNLSFFMVLSVTEMQSSHAVAMA